MFDLSHPLKDLNQQEDGRLFKEYQQGHGDETIQQRKLLYQPNHYYKNYMIYELSRG